MHIPLDRLALAALLAGSLAPAAQARTATTGPTDAAGLQAIIDQPGVDRVRLLPGKYHFASPVALTHAIAIQGASAGQRPAILADGAAFVVPSGAAIGSISLTALDITAAAEAILATPSEVINEWGACEPSAGSLASLEVSGSRISAAGTSAALTARGEIGSVRYTDDEVVLNPTFNGSFALSAESTTGACGGFPQSKLGKGVGSFTALRNRITSTSSFPLFGLGILVGYVPSVELAANVIATNGPGIIANAFDFDSGAAQPSAIHDNVITGVPVGIVGVGAVDVHDNRISAFGAGITGGTTVAYRDNVLQAVPIPDWFVGFAPQTVGIAGLSFCLTVDPSCAGQPAGRVANNRISGFDIGVGVSDLSAVGNQVRVGAPDGNALIGVGVSASGSEALTVAGNVVLSGELGGSVLTGVQIFLGVDGIANGAISVRENLVALGAGAGDGSIGIEVANQTDTPPAPGAQTSVAANIVYMPGSAPSAFVVGLEATTLGPTSVAQNFVEGPFAAGMIIVDLDPANSPAAVSASGNLVRGAFGFGFGVSSSTIVGNTIDLTADPTGTAQAFIVEDAPGYPSVISGNHLAGLLAGGQGAAKVHGSPLRRPRAADRDRDALGKAERWLPASIAERARVPRR